MRDLIERGPIRTSCTSVTQVYSVVDTLTLCSTYIPDKLWSYSVNPVYEGHILGFYFSNKLIDR